MIDLIIDIGTVSHVNPNVQLAFDRYNVKPSRNVSRRDFGF